MKNEKSNQSDNKVGRSYRHDRVVDGLIKHAAVALNLNYTEIVERCIIAGMPLVIKVELEKPKPEASDLIKEAESMQRRMVEEGALPPAQMLRRRVPRK